MRDDGTPGFVAVEYLQHGKTCALVTAARLVVNACASIEGPCPSLGEVQRRLAVLRYEHDKPGESKKALSADARVLAAAVKYCKDTTYSVASYMNLLQRDFPITHRFAVVKPGGDAEHARTELANFLHSRSIAVGLEVQGGAAMKLLYPSLDSTKLAQASKNGVTGHATVITAIDGDRIVLSDSNRPHRVELSWKELVAAATNVTLYYGLPAGAGKALPDGQVHARVLHATPKATPMSTNARVCVVPTRICDFTGTCTTAKRPTDKRPTAKRPAFNAGPTFNGSLLDTSSITVLLVFLLVVLAIVFFLCRGTRPARVGSEIVLRTLRARPGLSRAAHSLL